MEVSPHNTHTVKTAGGTNIRHAATNRVFQHDVSVPTVRDPIETMPNNSFSSSNVHSALYDFGERELSVRYLRDGTDAVYLYLNVPAATWQGLVDASSKGSYINASVAFNFRYFKLGRTDLPGRNAIADDRIRRFYYDP
jgi:hypothetical protein